jgi:hypothetical protein
MRKDQNQYGRRLHRRGAPIGTAATSHQTIKQANDKLHIRWQIIWNVARKMRAKQLIVRPKSFSEHLVPIAEIF